MKVTRAYDIVWDFGDDDDAIVNYLSDEYGWLVISYERESVEIIKI